MRLEVTLPGGWREVPAEKGHAYRREHPGAGTLRLSLVPGSPDLVGDGAAALARLEQLQEEIDLELGKMLRSSHGRAASGVVAATVRKHPRHGIIAQWLLPLGKVMALGTYQMGSRETVKREVREANRIIATARFLEVEDSPLVG